MFAGVVSVLYEKLFRIPQYVYGCVYWMTTSEKEMKMLVLDTGRMEFSIAEYPPEARRSRYYDIGMAEAGEGSHGMFVRSRDTSDMSYIIRRNNGGSSSWWQLEKTISMDSSRCHFLGSVGKHLYLYHGGSSSIGAGYFSIDSKTFQLKRVCSSKFSMYCPLQLAYSNFPPCCQR